MNIVMNLVQALQIVTALVMIGLVLIQHGKGADMGASFGSGASGSLFGATGSANFLSRSTAACAAVFFICTLSLAYTANDRPRASSGSVLDRPAGGASASAPPASGAAQIPGSQKIPGGVSAAPPSPSPVASGSLQAVPGTTAPAVSGASGAAAIPQK